MVLRLFGHFATEVGQKEMNLDFEDPITLHELLRILSSKDKTFIKIAASRDDADLSAHAVFFKKGVQLRLIDTITNNDTVEILIPAVGG
jgi:hypothetical protein